MLRIRNMAQFAEDTNLYRYLSNLNCASIANSHYQLGQYFNTYSVI